MSATSARSSGALARRSLLLVSVAVLGCGSRTGPVCQDHSDTRDAGLPAPRSTELPWDDVAIELRGAVDRGGRTEVTWEVEHGGRRLSYEPTFGYSNLSSLEEVIERGEVVDRITITLIGETRESASQSTGLIVRETFFRPGVSWETPLHLVVTWPESTDYTFLDGSANVTFLSVSDVTRYANVARPTEGEQYSGVFRIQSQLDVAGQWRLRVESEAPMDASDVPPVVRLEPRASRDFSFSVGPVPSGVEIGRLVSVGLYRPEMDAVAADIAEIVFTTAE